MKKTYKASCHCGRVRLEADLDLDEGSFRCNCTSCGKNRLWLSPVAAGNFRLLTGQDDLTEYESTRTLQYFCNVCGVRLFGRPKDDASGAQNLSLGALDDVDPAELAAIPIAYLDGLHDDWGSTPTVVKHL